jgi:hypothetical protein
MSSLVATLLLSMPAPEPVKPSRSPLEYQSWRGINGTKALRRAADRKSREARDRYIAAMGSDWLTRAEIAERLGLRSTHSIARTLRKMIAEELIEKNGCLYRIRPDEE